MSTITDGETNLWKWGNETSVHITAFAICFNISFVVQLKTTADASDMFILFSFWNKL